MICLLLSISCCGVFFVKQKTAYEMRISDWSSDVCSSDLAGRSRRCAITEKRRVKNARPSKSCPIQFVERGLYMNHPVVSVKQDFDAITTAPTKYADRKSVV